MITFLRIKKILFIIFSFNKKIFDLYIKNSDLLIDVGSNIGQFSLLYNLYFPKSDILSFEPNKEANYIYNKVFKSNRNIKLFSIGLSDIKKIQKLYITKSNDNSSFYLPLSENKKYEVLKTTNVETNLFDNFNFKLNNYTKVLLKIDVQGFELNVLKGFDKSLKYIKYVIIEVSFIKLYDNQDLFLSIKKFLENNNFRLIKEYNIQKSNSSKIQSDLIYEQK